MDVSFIVFVALLGVTALLAAIAIWSRRRTAVRTLAVVLTALFIPIPGQAESEGGFLQILETSLLLERRNQEETAFRFRLTGDGDLVPGSVTTLRRRLVTAPP